MIKKSTIKLDEFNDCLGKKYYENLFNEYEIKYEVVDLPDLNYYTNDEATLVLAFPEKDTYTMLNILCLMDADEKNYTRVGNKIVIRWWWD